MRKILIATMLLGSLEFSAAQEGEIPRAEISNGVIKASLYLPDAENGYYRATRFDWSGIISSLEYKGHNFFGQWFDDYGPTIHDAIMGPVESFGPLNYNETKPGANFVQIGVGVLTRSSADRYNSFNLYPIADPGIWSTEKEADKIRFTQEINDENYSYEYTKTVRLVPGKPEMVISHVLKNTGQKVIDTRVFNHNFFVFDKQPTGPGFELIFPANISGTGRGMGELAEIQGNKLVIKRELLHDETIYCSSLEGINHNASLYDIVVKNHLTGTGVRILGDRPLSKMVFWASPTTICPEPYIKIEVEPGKEIRWMYEYKFFVSDVQTN